MYKRLSIAYYIVQNFQVIKLLWLGHRVSICGKTFTFASKQRPQVPKHFEIRRKIFAVQAKLQNPRMFWLSNVLYYTVAPTAWSQNWVALQHSLIATNSIEYLIALAFYNMLSVILLCETEAALQVATQCTPFCTFCTYNTFSLVYICIHNQQIIQ